MFNKNELVLDKVRSVVTHDLATGKMLFRLTSLEEPTLQCTAEGEEITDAIGSVITTLYRAKKATFTATNSLLSLDLAAAQYGATKEIGGETISENVTRKITDSTYEILTVDGTGSDSKIVLKNVPTNDIKYIYEISNNEIGKVYTAGSVVSAENFVVDKKNKTIKTPTGVTGKIYVEYDYETENALRISNKSSQFPESCSVVIYAYFRDKCNDNIVYSGKIISKKAKLNPEQVELALTSTGKHSLTLDMMKDYCTEEGDDELFAIIVAE